jgi:hypothetical protein
MILDAKGAHISKDFTELLYPKMGAFSDIEQNDAHSCNSANI